MRSLHTIGICLLLGTVTAQQPATNPPVARVPVIVPQITVPAAPTVPQPLDPRTATATPNTVTAPRRQPVAAPPSPFDLTGRNRLLPSTRPAVPPPTNPAALPPPVPAAPTNTVRQARTWRVGQGPGTDFPTIQKAAESAQPGDTVLVQAGMYAGFRTVRSGTAEAPITFRAEPGALVHLNGHTPADHIVVRNTDWIVVAGFTVRDAARAGIVVIDASDVVVSNNVVGPNGVWAIFTGFAPRVRILDNKAFGSRKEHGIYVSNSRVAPDGPVVRGNDCYANAASGIQFNGDCHAGGDGILSQAVIENNIIHDNDSKGVSLISIEDSLVQNNLVYNNGRKSGAAGIHLTDELGCGKPSRRNLVVNNTIVESRIAGLRLTDGATGNVIFNNLLVGRGIVDESGGNQIDGHSNVQRDTAAAVFVSAATGDYRLQPLLAGMTGLSSFSGRSAPQLDFSGATRAGLAPLVGACDSRCGPLPVPRQFDPKTELQYTPAPLVVP